MMLADGLAVFAGTTRTHLLPMARPRLIAALLFIAFGLTAMAATLGLFCAGGFTSPYVSATCT
jgi:putative Ca2+/H+ antiporter (TMEM165/GDT1 family)